MRLLVLLTVVPCTIAFFCGSAPGRWTIGIPLYCDTQVVAPWRCIRLPEKFTPGPLIMRETTVMDNRRVQRNFILSSAISMLKDSSTNTAWITSMAKVTEKCGSDQDWQSKNFGREAQTRAQAQAEAQAQAQAQAQASTINCGRLQDQCKVGGGDIDTQQATDVREFFATPMLVQRRLITRYVKALIADAKIYKPVFDTVVQSLQEIVSSVGRKTYKLLNHQMVNVAYVSPHFEAVGIKAEGRILDKGLSKYGCQPKNGVQDVTDVVRGSLVFEDEASLCFFVRNALSHQGLESVFQNKGVKVEIRGHKNRFAKDAVGMRDLLVNLWMLDANSDDQLGHVTELQLHLRPMVNAKHIMHCAYKYLRRINEAIDFEKRVPADILCDQPRCRAYHIDRIKFEKKAQKWQSPLDLIYSKWMSTPQTIDFFNAIFAEPETEVVVVTGLAMVMDNGKHFLHVSSSTRRRQEVLSEDGRSFEWNEFRKIVANNRIKTTQKVSFRQLKRLMRPYGESTENNVFVRIHTLMTRLYDMATYPPKVKGSFMGVQLQGTGPLYFGEQVVYKNALDKEHFAVQGDASKTMYKCSQKLDILATAKSPGDYHNLRCPNGPNRRASGAARVHNVLQPAQGPVAAVAAAGPQGPTHPFPPPRGLQTPTHTFPSAPPSLPPRHGRKKLMRPNRLNSGGLLNPKNEAQGLVPAAAATAKKKKESKLKKLMKLFRGHTRRGKSRS